MSNKYELTQETIKVDGRTLYRIRALRNLEAVKAGELGGFIESEDNLSNACNCWVFGNAQVFETARISGNARISENAQVSGNAYVHGTSKIFGNAKISGDANIFANAQVSGNAYIDGDVHISHNAQVSGNAYVCGNIYFGKVKLDQGIWNRVIKINKDLYLVSTTLKRVLVGESTNG